MEFLRYDHQVDEGRKENETTPFEDELIYLLRVPGLVSRHGIGAGVQADRAIRTGKLNALLRLHTQPIDVVVFHGSRRDLVLRLVSRLDAFSGYLVRT